MPYRCSGLDSPRNGSIASCRSGKSWAGKSAFLNSTTSEKVIGFFPGMSCQRQVKPWKLASVPGLATAMTARAPGRFASRRSQRKVRLKFKGNLFWCEIDVARLEICFGIQQFPDGLFMGIALQVPDSPSSRSSPIMPLRLLPVSRKQSKGYSAVSTEGEKRC